jgi:16S rRNA (uracil1498-N3)-methyltransferase
VSLPVFVVNTATLAANQIELTGDEGHHAAVVRRIRVGERLLLTDGRGRGAECVVRSVAKRSLVADVVAHHSEDPPTPRVTVVQALLKGDAGERAVDLLTQVGVDDIIPWPATRCVALWQGERGEKALRRWRAAAVEAGKQSRRLWFPVVHDAFSTDAVAGLVQLARCAVLLHEDGPTRVRDLDVPRDGDVILIVGPEGGVTDEETDRLCAAGALPLRLGPSVLRGYAAGAAGAAVVLSRTDRWGG